MSKFNFGCLFNSIASNETERTTFESFLYSLKPTKIILGQESFSKDWATFFSLNDFIPRSTESNQNSVDFPPSETGNTESISPHSCILPFPYAKTLFLEDEPEAGSKAWS